MKLPIIHKGEKYPNKGFYFGCDTKYFELYGKALALSIKEKASWANTHIHIFNPYEDQLEWCNRQSNLSVTWEYIKDIDELQTYYACVRFIRIPEIYENHQPIISFDCDMLMNKKISEEYFDSEVLESKVTCKPKNGDSLASSIIFGPDDFRNLYAHLLKKEFEKNNIYWFLDQHILNQIIKDKHVNTMGFEWTGLKMNDNEIMWTAKGNKKQSKQQYVKLVDHYNNIAKGL